MSNELLTPKAMSVALLQSFAQFRRNPLVRRGLSQSHRRKLLKQRGMAPIGRPSMYSAAVSDG